MANESNNNENSNPMEFMNENPPNRATLTEAELKGLVNRLIKEEFSSMGLEVDNKNEMQRDFIHLRDQRKSKQGLQHKVTISMIVTILTGLLIALVAGIKELFKGN